MDNLKAQKQAAIEARRAYQKEWRKKNPDKVREAQDRYWMNRAAKMLQEQGQSNDSQ